MCVYISTFHPNYPVYRGEPEDYFFPVPRRRNFFFRQGIGSQPIHGFAVNSISVPRSLLCPGEAHRIASSVSKAPAEAGDTSPFPLQNNAFALLGLMVRAALQAFLDDVWSFRAEQARAIFSSNATFRSLEIHVVFALVGVRGGAGGWRVCTVFIIMHISARKTIDPSIQ